MNNPVLIWSDHELWPSPILRNVWLPLGNDYYLCCWRWKTLFDTGYNGKPDYYQGGRTCGYYSYNVKNNKDIANNVVLMKDKWDGLPNILPIHLDTMVDTYKTNHLLKEGDTTIYVIAWYDWLYSTSDISQIFVERPLAEHYVVTAKSLYSFTHSPLTDQDKIFLGYEPAYMNPRMILDIMKANIDLDEPLLYLKNKSIYNALDWWPTTNIVYDSLLTEIGRTLKDVIESGRLHEYIEYDYNYNHVDEKRSDYGL